MLVITWSPSDPPGGFGDTPDCIVSEPTVLGCDDTGAESELPVAAGPDDPLDATEVAES